MLDVEKQPQDVHLVAIILFCTIKISEEIASLSTRYHFDHRSFFSLLDRWLPIFRSR